MKQLSLDNLRTFVTVVDTGGYAKAGDILGRSQPAVSLQIKRLEDQLGKRLFSKTGQRHQANTEGMLLYQRAKAMLAINDELFKQFEQTSIRGRLRLGIPSEFAATLLPNIIGEFSALYPDVALEVTSALSQSLLSRDNRTQYDLVMALVDPSTSPTSIPEDGDLLLKDELVWVGSKQQGFNHQALSLVLAPDGCVYRSRVIGKLKQQTIQWRISYTNADLSGIASAITQGLGITALARSSVPTELSVFRHRALPKLGHINIYLFNQSERHPQASSKLAEFIQARLGR